MSILIGSNTKIKDSIIGRDKKREKELEQEITRLNNIINELEKEISRHIALCSDITLNDILDKLNELKENK